MTNPTFTLTQEQAATVQNIAELLWLTPPRVVSQNGALVELETTANYSLSGEGVAKMGFPFRRLEAEVFGLGDATLRLLDSDGEPVFEVDFKVGGDTEILPPKTLFAIPELESLNETLKKLVQDPVRFELLGQVVKSEYCREREVTVFNPEKIDSLVAGEFMNQSKGWEMFRFVTPDETPDGYPFASVDDFEQIQLKLNLVGFTKEEASSFGGRLTDYRDIYLIEKPGGNYPLKAVLGPTQAQVDRMVSAHMDFLDSNGNKGRRGTFSRMNLSGLKFEGVDVSWGDFSNADLTNTRWSDVKASGAKFNGANLERSVFTNVTVINADALRTNFSEVGVFGGSFQRTNFSESDFKEANIRGDFSGCRFSSCSFQDTTIFESSLEEASFKESNFFRGTVAFSNLERADFTFSKGVEATFATSNLKDTNWTNAE